MQKLKNLVLLLVIQSFAMQASIDNCVDIHNQNVIPLGNIQKSDAKIKKVKRSYEDYQSMGIQSFVEEKLLQYNHPLPTDGLNALIEKNKHVSRLAVPSEYPEAQLISMTVKFMYKIAIDAFVQSGADQQEIAELIRESRMEANRLYQIERLMKTPKGIAYRSAYKESGKANESSKKFRAKKKQQAAFSSQRDENQEVNNQESPALESADQVLKKPQLSVYDAPETKKTRYDSADGKLIYHTLHSLDTSLHEKYFPKMK